MRRPVRALTRSTPRLPLPLVPRRHQRLLSRLLLPLHPLTRSLPLSAAPLLNRPGNGEAVAFCGVHFFGIMASGGVLRHL